EDGIRDRNVTGVQTCALPISFAFAASNLSSEVDVLLEGLFDSIFSSEDDFFICCEDETSTLSGLTISLLPQAESNNNEETPNIRSEERRVGKVCRNNM